MIINATPHVINIYKQEQVTSDTASRKLILNKDESPIISIKPFGKLLNAQKTLTPSESVGDIPIFSLKFLSVDDPLEVFAQVFDPEVYSDSHSYIIVSQLYVAAYKATMIPCSDYTLLTVGDVVYDDSTNPRPCGCLGLVQN